MKESEAKTKMCPQLFSALTISASMAITNGASEEAIRDIMRKGVCSGSECVMWEPEYKEERYVQEEATKPPEPECEWHKKEHVAGETRVVWFRYVPTDVGDCGLKSKECNCGYPG